MAWRSAAQRRISAFVGCTAKHRGSNCKLSALCRPRVLSQSEPMFQHNYAVRYSSTAAPTTKNSTYDASKVLLALDSVGKTLTVTWKDGSKSRFHSIWLRHSCHCGHCMQEHSGQKLIDPATVSHHVSIEKVCIDGDHLEIQWKGSPPHVGHVPLSFLQTNCYESDYLSIKRESVKLGPPAQAIPQLYYSDLIKTSDGVLRWLRQINEAGVSLMKDVPTEDNMVQKIAEHIGPAEDLIYGETWDVISTPKPINVAYSTVGLDFHMDLIYYESPPGLQFLHCLRFDECVEGGESHFLDVFHVAEAFRKSHPNKFHTLSQIPATFQKIHYARDFPVEMKYQRPHIVLNQYQEHEVEPYYEAYQEFAKAIKYSPDIVECQLKPGDLVTFNNRRILHARKSFDLNGGVRHLKGCYVNIDHFKSQVQVFSSLHGTGQPAKRVGNQDWF
ncbi:gamma-butyrobetaine dioxygenase-like isoform X2 [Littorina saxatilis]|uniref:gamma-butyrobetaine dioxygenase-like isoform X2 n=1 Tax=Littorina saxatilis TaxID=31220 RepID=UPI0038B45F05